MPQITLPIDSGGPILELLVGVSLPRSGALKKAGKQIPRPILARALVDTGASCTCVDPSLLQFLGVVSTGTTPVHTPSTQSSAPHIARQYDVSIILQHATANRTFPAIPVIESHLDHHGIQVLLGRDILAACLMTYDGPTKMFALSF